MKKKVKEEAKEIKGIFRRFKSRDFSGNAGQAIKNSTWQIATMVVAKVGALFFMILLARLLIPELFGLYSLTLSTLILFSAFSDLGISTALLTFLSKKFGEKDYKKAKSYYNYLLKYKLLLLIIPTILLLVLSKFLSETYYQKPIFYALLAGILYLPANNLGSFFNQIFIAGNNFRIGFIKELLFQISRLTLVPITILLLITLIPSQFLISTVFLIIGIIYFLTTFFLYYNIPKNLKNSKTERLSLVEKKNLKKFIFPLSVTALSGMFFGSIDMIMLGHFVMSEFIGYYQSAFSLITALSAFLAFSGVALFPIFSRLKGKKLERGFKESIKIITIITLPTSILTFLMAPLIIHIIYGVKYASAVPILQLFSLLLISIPLTSIYVTYYISRGDTLKYSFLLIFSTVINIILNYILITNLISKGMLLAVMGAGIATIISGYIFLVSLIIFRKKS